MSQRGVLVRDHQRITVMSERQPDANRPTWTVDHSRRPSAVIRLSGKSELITLAIGGDQLIRHDSQVTVYPGRTTAGDHRGVPVAVLSIGHNIIAVAGSIAYMGFAPMDDDVCVSDGVRVEVVDVGRHHRVDHGAVLQELGVNEVATGLIDATQVNDPLVIGRQAEREVPRIGAPARFATLRFPEAGLSARRPAQAATEQGQT